MAYNFLTLKRIPVKLTETEPTVWVASFPKPNGLYDHAELWIECYQFIARIEKSPAFKDATPNFSLTLKEIEKDETVKSD